MSTEPKAPGKGLVPNIISGLATGLFSIPEGMAYAQLAGVNPVYGLYSGIVATMVASLTTGTVLMLSTLTSAIALATGSVLQTADIQSSQMPAALFTVTFLVGTIMFVLGLARLGSIVNFVSNAVMTGFVAGASWLIITGQEHHLTGYSPTGANTFEKSINWLQNIDQWDMTTVAVSVSVIVFMVLLKRVRPLEKFAPIIVLVLATAIVNLLSIQTELVGEHRHHPQQPAGLHAARLQLDPAACLGFNLGGAGGIGARRRHQYGRAQSRRQQGQRIARLPWPGSGQLGWQLLPVHGHGRLAVAHRHQHRRRRQQPAGRRVCRPVAGPDCPAVWQPGREGAAWPSSAAC